MESFNRSLRTMLDNKYVFITLSVIIALYAGLAAPALPNSVILFFDTMVGRFLFLFIIAYLASQNLQVALIVAVAYLVTLQLANRRVNEHFADKVADTKSTFETDMCSMLNTLDETTTPKKSEVVNMTVNDFVSGYVSRVYGSGTKVGAVCGTKVDTSDMKQGTPVQVNDTSKETAAVNSTVMEPAVSAALTKPMDSPKPKQVETFDVMPSRDTDNQEEPMPYVDTSSMSLLAPY